MNSEFAIRFQISENVSVMLNFSVFHHFGKLTVNEGFCAVLAVVCGVIFRSGLSEIHSCYDKKGLLKGFGLLCTCNLDAKKCQKSNYRKFIRITSIVLWVRTQLFSSASA